METRPLYFTLPIEAKVNVLKSLSEELLDFWFQVDVVAKGGGGCDVVLGAADVGLAAVAVVAVASTATAVAHALERWSGVAFAALGTVISNSFELSKSWVKSMVVL